MICIPFYTKSTVQPPRRFRADEEADVVVEGLAEDAFDYYGFVGGWVNMVVEGVGVVEDDDDVYVIIGVDLLSDNDDDPPPTPPLASLAATVSSCSPPSSPTSPPPTPQSPQNAFNQNTAHLLLVMNILIHASHPVRPNRREDEYSWKQDFGWGAVRAWKAREGVC